MATSKNAGFTLIDASDVEVAPRGRKVETDPVLVKAFESLTEGQGVRLDSFGSVAKEDRAKVGQTIRKNWNAARGGRDKCSINYGNTGVPQVTIAKPKATAAE